MIILDADVLVVELGQHNDPRRGVNRQALDRLQADRHPLGITQQGLLEVVGSLSFNTSPAAVPRLPALVCARYGLVVLPDPVAVPGYAGCTVSEIVSQMCHQMSLGDAIMAIQIDRLAPAGSILLTWNAKHFAGKVSVPVLTPAEWLQQQAPAGPTP